MNYIVMLYNSALAFCQTEEQARALKPDLPGAAIYEACGDIGEDAIILFGRYYKKLL